MIDEQLRDVRLRRGGPARALADRPAAAVDEAIGRVLKQVARGTELVVRVHPDIAGEIERLIAERQAGERRRLHLQVVPDDALSTGDALIDWDSGCLTLDASARRSGLLNELAPLLRTEV